MNFIKPKLNWNRADYYNASDLNRVENNTLVLANILSKYFKDTKIITEVRRDFKSITFAEDLNRIESNIELIRDNFHTPFVFEVPKVNWAIGDRFSFIDANRLENNLWHLFLLINNATDNFKYCGTLNCGEGGI
ncbi:MAG: hypothetical protein ACRCVJ_12455 [Clostridium sp.]|uniref:hypothetical protein n=1 Tax=Clostridium sp. TaxID=1506 RepID=UPI003F313126